MKKILSFLIVAATIYFVACNVEEEPISQTRELPTKNPYAISIPQAIERLNAIFPDATKTTRATTADVTTLTRGDFGLTTRAVNGALPTDPLIYIIPTDNSGCAIVGADTRMEAVYAVLDNSTLTAEDILGIETRSDSQNEEDGAEIKEFVSAMLNDAITFNARMVGTGDSYPTTENEYDTMIVALKVAPLLKTKWHQESPFSICFAEEFNRVAGCGPIAAAQILYYHRQPEYIESELSPFDWYYISRCEYGQPFVNDTNQYSREASRFIWEIAQVMEARPNSGGTGVSETGVLNVIQLTQFRDNADIIPYNGNRVIEMLNQDLPIYTMGMRNADKGHSWVIDGYEYRYYYNKLTPTTFVEYKDPETYVHCNYGWRGYCDGYYLNGVFDLSELRSGENLETSIGDKVGSREYFYNRDLKILYYLSIY